MDPLSRVVKAVQENISMSDGEKLNVEHEFKTSCDSGKDYITFETLRGVINEELKGLVPQEYLSFAVDHRMNQIKQRDRDGDGKVTKDEFFKKILFDIMRMSLFAEDKNWDAVLSKEELVSWLEKKLKLTDDRDRDACADAIIKTYTPEGQETKLEDVIRGLFDKAFPPETPKRPMTMTKIIDIIRLFFALSEVDKERYSRSFDTMSGSSKSVSLPSFDEYMDQTIDKLFEGDKTKAWIRRHMRERLYRKRVLPIQDRQADIVTCEEYTHNTMYLSMLKTFVTIGGTKFDGDNVMDSEELAKWLKENCSVEDPEAVDLIIKEFKHEGQKDLLIKDLIDGLFNRAFPPAEVRIQEIADKVSDEFKPKGSRGRRAEKDFETFSKGTGFIDLAKVKDIMKEDIENKLKSATDKDKEYMLERRMKQIKKKDRNNDGKITKTEFIENSAYWTLNMSLQGKGDGYDGLLDREELMKWLTSWCNIEEYVEDYADAIILTFKQFSADENEELKTADVVNKIFECAFPTSEVRRQKVLESFRQQAGLSDSIAPADVFQEELLKSFKGQDALTRDACKTWLADVCGLTSEAYVDALLETVGGKEPLNVKDLVDYLLKH